MVRDKVKIATVDFDHEDLLTPVHFVARLFELGLESHIEVSKSKGYHVWLFFSEFVNAAGVRIIIRRILAEMDKGDVEVFPKQDCLQGGVCFGNFINAPLFGKLVLKGKTTFLDLDNMPKPYSDQWQFLQEAKRHSQEDINGILSRLNVKVEPPNTCYSEDKTDDIDSYGLVPCIRHMLQNGVDSFQRVSCFRLAVRLRRIGLPFDIAVAVLEAWAAKNNPIDGKRTITTQEIHWQAADGYKSKYRGFGCEHPAISRFCDENCPIFKSRIQGN